MKKLVLASLFALFLLPTPTVFGSNSNDEVAILGIQRRQERREDRRERRQERREDRQERRDERRGVPQEEVPQ